MPQGKGTYGSQVGRPSKKKDKYAQNPYGGMYAGVGKTTQNYEDFKEAMPKQGPKSDQQLNQELTDEELQKERKGKGKTLLTSSR